MTLEELQQEVKNIEQIDITTLPPEKLNELLAKIESFINTGELLLGSEINEDTDDEDNS